MPERFMRWYAGAWECASTEQCTRRSSAKRRSVEASIFDRVYEQIKGIHASTVVIKAVFDTDDVQSLKTAIISTLPNEDDEAKMIVLLDMGLTDPAARWVLKGK